MQFTLVNVAAAVHGSELPAQFAQTGARGVYGHADVRGEGESEMDGVLAEGGVGDGVGARHLGSAASGDQQDIAEVWGEKRIFMQRRVDGSPVLHLD